MIGAAVTLWATTPQFRRLVLVSSLATFGSVLLGGGNVPSVPATGVLGAAYTAPPLNGTPAPPPVPGVSSAPGVPASPVLPAAPAPAGPVKIGGPSVRADETVRVGPTPGDDPVYRPPAATVIQPRRPAGYGVQ